MIPCRWLAVGLCCGCVVQACSDSGSSGSDAGRADGRVATDGGADGSLSDGGADLPGGDGDQPLLPDAGSLPDVALPDAATPGCGAACVGDEVCFEGLCTEPGPTKTCGTGKYPGGLPANDGTFFVDATAAAGGDGSQAAPFSTITEALAEIPTDKKYTVAVAAGSYDEAVLIGQRPDGAAGEVAFGADLFCACPGKVILRQGIEIVPRGDLSVTIDGCSVMPAGHDACQWPSCPGDDDEESFGIAVKGGDRAVHVLVRDSVVAGWCAGIYFSAMPAALADASLCVARSRIAGNLRGVDLGASPLSASVAGFDECKGLQESATLVLDQLDHNRDYGVLAREQARGIAMKANLVEAGGTLCGSTAGEGFGVLLADIESASVTANLIRHNEGRGIALRNSSVPSPYAIMLAQNVVADNGAAGLALQDIDVLTAVAVTANQVVATRAIAGEPGGDGIQVIGGANVELVGNTIDASARHGMLLHGVGSGTVDGNALTNNGGCGVVLQQSSAALATGNSFNGNVGGDSCVDPDPPVDFGALPPALP